MDWELTGVIASIIAVAVALWQLRAQFAVQSRERAVEAYFRFTDRFSQLSERYYAFRKRVDAADRRVQLSDCENYFRQYWRAQLQQWEFAGTGLLPDNIYARWLLYANDYMFEGRDFAYFDGDVRASKSALEGYQIYGRSVLRNQPDAITFFDSVLALSQGRAARFEDILALVKSNRRKRQARWRA